jgi:hypothetical protein
VSRFDETDVLERLFDETVQQPIKKGWVSLHWSVDGTLTRANASHKSFVPIEVLEKPEEYRKTMKGQKKETKNPDDDPGNPDVDWKGQKRSNATHRSTTDPDARIATKSNKETAVPAYTVNGIMENRNRLLMGIGVEIFHGLTSERNGALALLDQAKKKFYTRPKTLGGDKGYFVEGFIQALFSRKIEPHVAVYERGSTQAHGRIRQRLRGLAYSLSQRARKRIEELWGEAKEYHGLRRFLRRTLVNVRQEALLMGWLLNLKRLATLEARAAA